MTIKRKYMNTMPGTQYLFKNGKAAQFTQGFYLTDVADEIAELDSEIKNGIPHIYINPDDATVDTGKEDFIRARQIEATKQAIKDYEAGQVTQPTLAKNPDGTVHKPGASEAQSVQITGEEGVQVGAQGASTNAVTSPNTTSPVKVNTGTPQNGTGGVNMANLLAARGGAGTGVASSDNAPQAAKSSS